MISTQGQEEVFKIFDELIEEGVNITSNITSRPSLRIRIQRNFIGVGNKSSTRVALEMYGFNYREQKPTPSELMDCLYITDAHTVNINEYRYNDVLACYDLTSLQLNAHLKKYRSELEMDALSRLVGEDDIYDFKLIHQNRTLTYWVEKHYSNFPNFYKQHQLDVRLLNDYTRENIQFLITAGNDFERLVERCLYEKNGDTINCTYTKQDCRPDFIVEELWIDAKLSKSTALDPRCKTIEKYLNHTDKLTIIYAIDDVDEAPNYDGRVDFVHISEFYPYITDDLMADITELTSAVKERKTPKY